MYIDFIFCPLNRHLLIVIITKDATLFNKNVLFLYYEEQNVTFAFTYKYLFSPTALQSISRLSLQVPLRVT